MEENSSTKVCGSSDEKAPDSSDNGVQIKLKAAKGKKRRKPKDVTAPRYPLSGKYPLFTILFYEVMLLTSSLISVLISRLCALLE